MSINYLGTRQLQINELQKTNVNFFKYTSDVKQKSLTNHHILLADVSGSMYSNIKTLKEHIKITVDALLQIPNSYISIITYSGHNESQRIINAVKCDAMSYSMSKLYEVIDSELYTKSVTVISEPLEEAIKIASSLADVCDKHHIALFTDGCLVPYNWSDEHEENLCFNIAKTCSEQGIFLNAIGFGQYYDREFLKCLVKVAGNGGLIHIDYVKDYSDVILEVIKKVNEQDLIKQTLYVDEGYLFHVENSMKNQRITLTKDGIFALVDGNIFYVKGSEANDLPITIETNSIKDVADDIIDDYYYSLARYYLQEEDVDNYEFIVQLLGDTHLLNRTQNCYSFLEKGNAVNLVGELLEDKTKRFIDGRNITTHNIEDEPLCLLEILQLIMNDNNSMLYWDMNIPYHRITQATKSNEDSIIFERKSVGFTPVTNITIGSEKLNIGVKVRIEGCVTDTISGLQREACIYRDYNIINSGNVNVPYICAKLSPVLLSLFKTENLIASEPLIFTDNVIYKINLFNIKSTNKRILKSMGVNNLLSSLKEISELKCEQWAINQIIKEVLNDKDKIDFSENLSPLDMEIMKTLRIDDNGIYKPLSIEKDTATPFEIYPAIYLTWDIKFSEKKKKQECLEWWRTHLENNGYVIGVDDNEIISDLNKMLEQTRREMRNKEFSVNCVRIASALMNKSPFIWDVHLEKDKKTTDKVLNRNMIVGGKVKISKKALGEDMIEQKKWIQLIKAN